MVPLAKKYIEFARFVEDIKFKHALNSKELDILLVIAASTLDDKKLKVRQLLDMEYIASPATIHKCMKILISKELICVNSCEKDARIKYLSATNKGMKFLKEIGRKM